jgi:hypothetical protein
MGKSVDKIYNSPSVFITTSVIPRGTSHAYALYRSRVPKEYISNKVVRCGDT